jgi:hypothetical protein
MRDIFELDEAQGLTAEMIRGKFEALGYPVRECQNYSVCPSLGKHTHHGKGQMDFIVPDEWVDADNIWPAQNLSASLKLAASMAGLSIQALLRQINPRMRKGWPSNASIAAHGLPDGNWLMKDDEGVLRSGYFFDHSGDVKSFAYDTEGGGEWMFSTTAAECSFWPCDEAGNKVRWPTDDHGAML